MCKVAAVTGSNQGIGLATVKGLLPNFDGDVYLTARNEERGLEAIEQLKKVGFLVEKLSFFKKQVGINY